ncbi:hypothetical protein [Rhodanobacter glycinis]|uniref:Uncharacterized protein n=1 Tax=Rhodanobacter glycinis TaxID=582702 RepID=A0A1I4FRT8_9GAMM|nr:hypothetical protein [Rhodanobacter glycinis]SFL19707.1 hypothetical protein SAMN05192579_11910 [Rhodanobacter glycinis]
MNWQRWWYGPIFSVPELCDLPPRRQHALWNEAVRRGVRPARMLALLMVRFVVAMTFATLALELGMAEQALWVGLLALVSSGFVADALMTRPVARRWLREHAHELNRYATS